MLITKQNKASKESGYKILLKVPSKNNPEVVELISLLKDLHKWKDLVVLDSFKLVKMIEEDKFSSDEMKKLRKFIEKKKVEFVRLSKFDKD